MLATTPLPQQVLDTLVRAGIDLFVSVPCNTLGGLLDACARDPRLRHLPVTREEEGVGVCAGAALAGHTPALLMQNSGLGNCLNALLSLTRLYELPLVLLISYRGGPNEQIAAQVPMGRAMRGLLDTAGIRHRELERAEQLPELADLVRETAGGRVVAGILWPSFWKTTP